MSSQNRSKSKTTHKKITENYNNFKGRSMKSSTPLPRKCVQDNYKLCIDQATQTEGLLLQPPIAKIEEMEAILKNLYLRFESLVTQLNLNQELTSFSKLNTEQNNGDNIFEAQGINNHTKEQQPIERKNDVITKQEIEILTAEPVNSSTAPIEDKDPVSKMRVRRMSAQTTNNIEGVPSIDADMVT